ncbi:hypothetical protein BCR44DRAFT_44631 [Catenaria anguillulae PL171]|uniref:Uncharacterized protein n=1 Tax=Catenaria anguillulae PL171 TaxID=765915 RepID=A0A1Y2HU72_9FUNG|nr:hypothetical protein BCR44DRAFT_44631 [Catenaria anguillulae PL171]
MYSRGQISMPMQSHARNDLSAIPRQQPGIPGYPGYPRPGTRAAYPLEPLGLNSNSLSSFLALFSAIPDQLGHLLSVYMTRCNTLIAYYCHQYPVAAPYLSRFALAAALPLALYALYSGVTLVFSSAVAVFTVLGVQLVAMLFGLMVLLLGLGSIAGVFFVMFLAEYYQVINRTRALGLAVMDAIVGSPEDEDHQSMFRGRSATAGGARSLTLRPPASARHSAMLLHPAADASGASFAGPLHSADAHSTMSARTVPLGSAHHYVPEHHMPSPTQEYYDDDDEMIHHQPATASSSSIINGQYSTEYPVPTPTPSPSRQPRPARKSRTRTPKSASAAIRPTSSISSRSLDPEDLPSDDSDADEPLADFVEQSNADADEWDEQIYGGGGLKMRANKNTKRSSVLSALSVLLSSPVQEEREQEEQEEQEEALERDERQRVRYDEVDTDQTDAMAKLMGRAGAGSSATTSTAKKRSSDWRRSLAEMDRELVEDLRRIGEAEEKQLTHVIVEEEEEHDDHDVAEAEEGELIEVEVEEEIEVEVDDNDNDNEDAGEVSITTAAALALPPTPPLSESKLAVSA